MKSKALETLVGTTGARVSDIIKAEIMATTIHELVKAGPEEIDDPTLSTNGLKVAVQATEALEVRTKTNKNERTIPFS